MTALAGTADREPGSVFVITAYDLGPKAKHALRRRRRKRFMKKQNKFPPGWDEARVRRVLEHYESQTDEDLVPVVRELIAKHRRSA